MRRNRSEPTSSTLLGMLAIACTLGAVVLLAPGCRASGTSERISPHWRAPESPDMVDLYFEPVDRPHELIARISATGETRRFGSLALAEAAVYEKLRDLAARYGALAIIEIDVVVTVDGEPVEVDLQQRSRPVENHVITARAKAVRFRGR